MRSLTSSMKLCHSDLQKLGEKPLPFMADMPRQFISHTVQNGQGIYNLNNPALQGDGCLPAVEHCPWCSKIPWEKATRGEGSPQPSDTNPWGCPGKGAVFCSQRQLPLGRSCLQVPPSSKKTMQPSLYHCKKHKPACRRHLTASGITKVPPSGTWTGNSYLTYAPLAFSKGYTLNFMFLIQKRDTFDTCYWFMKALNFEIYGLYSITLYCNLLFSLLELVLLANQLFASAKHKGTFQSWLLYFARRFPCHQGGYSSFVLCQ